MITDPRNFSVEVLCTDERKVRYFNWMRDIKRFVKGRPQGTEVLKALEWAEKSGAKSINLEGLTEYEDRRIVDWEGEIMNLIMRFTDGSLKTMLSSLDNGMDAWRATKWHFEPQLAERSALHMEEFVNLLPVKSNGEVVNALRHMLDVEKKYIGSAGKTIDADLKKVKIMNLLPEELRGRVRRRTTAETSAEQIEIIIMEEIRDPRTGKIPISSKTQVNSFEYQNLGGQQCSLCNPGDWGGGKGDWNCEGCCEEQEWEDESGTPLDSISKGGKKGKGGKGNTKGGGKGKSETRLCYY